MKIRQSFVTNSSSSSYVVVIEKEYFNQQIKKLSPYLTAVYKALKENNNITEKKFLGTKVVVLTYVSGNYSTMEDLSVDYEAKDEDEEAEIDELRYESINKILELMTDEDKVFQEGVDC